MLFVDNKGHLISDHSLDELHQMADKLGLKREWFQDKKHPHYDLITRYRKPNLRLIQEAVSLGAVLSESKELIKALRRFRRLNEKSSVSKM